jgi:hypothetical protein
MGNKIKKIMKNTIYIELLKRISTSNITFLKDVNKHIQIKKVYLVYINIYSFTFNFQFKTIHST